MLFTHGTANDGGPTAPVTCAARVAFAGPRSGFVDVRASDDVVAAAARNMLADDAAGPDLCFDAIAELANVICGNLTPSLGERDAVYRLAAPVRAPLVPAPDADACVELAVETGRVEVRLVFTEPAAVRS
ncbi:MAG: chemotaxis protein CheX [Acidobacteriota bacterium]|nr:chemotaxis protein CheX [Acidobacteriota bacterium]